MLEEQCYHFLILPQHSHTDGAPCSITVILPRYFILALKNEENAEGVVSYSKNRGWVAIPYHVGENDIQATATNESD